LLKSVTSPSDYTFRKISNLAKPDARLTIVLNRTIYEDVSYFKKLGLQDAQSSATQEAITRSLRKHGFKQVRISYPSKTELKTSWGQRLTLGSNRSLIQITGVKTGVETKKI